MDLGLTYINGPLSAGVSYNKRKNFKANYALGAQYRFGMFALAAGYHHSRNGIHRDGTTNAKLNGFTLGGRATFGAASILLDVARQTKATYEVANVSYKGKKVTNALLEGRYAFSKRTFVYATYLRYEEGNNYGVGVRHDF